MESKRRTAISFSRRQRRVKSTAKGATAGDSQSVRPQSRKTGTRPQTGKVQSIKSPLKKTRAKKASSKRPRSKSPGKSYGPKDPMTSPNLGAEDLEELKTLEKLFLDNQNLLRQLIPPPTREPSQTNIKASPLASRRSGVSLPQSRPTSKVGPQRPADPVKIQKSKEDLTAELMVDTVKYFAREWAGMKVMRDFIPKKV